MVSINIAYVSMLRQALLILLKLYQELLSKNLLMRKILAVTLH